MELSLEGKRVGFAMTGSYCTFDTALECLEEIVMRGAEVTAIISYAADETDTRFISADELKNELIRITGKPVIRSITEAEPIGPQKLFDILLVLPATGNTLAKLALGITDTPVTMAVKAHLRNNRPVVLAISTNDALGGSAKNIGMLMNTKHFYFVPFAQDNPEQKPKSMIFLKNRVIPALADALSGKQLQPLFS